MSGWRDKEIRITRSVRESRVKFFRRFRCYRKSAYAVIFIWVVVVSTNLLSGQGAPAWDESSIRGTVVDASSKPVANALIRLQRNDGSGTSETKSTASGTFILMSIPQGSYTLTAEKAGLRSHAMTVVATANKDQSSINLVLNEQEDVQSVPPASRGVAMEFSDKPNFSVAGVTDWTAVGGHGSDSTLRTSEALARDIVTMKPEQTHVLTPQTADRQREANLRAALAESPDNFETNHQLGDFYLREGRYAEALPPLKTAYGINPSDYDNTYDLALACEEIGDYARARDEVRQLLGHRDDADLHRLAGGLDEKLGDSLAAVREYELAATADPSEQNYFAWGSELLLHRAIWQAQEVFRKGAEAYPQSERMLTGFGAALFAGAVYDEASLRFCAASDLNPASPEPYTFMGRIEMAAPIQLPCIEPRLARYARDHADSSDANYLYAMALVRRQQWSRDPSALQQAQALLQKAVNLDTKCSEAWLQLGIMSYEKRDFATAINDYTKAIAANPQLAEAHYRLAVAYDRTGESAKANQEFQLHDQIEKAEGEAVERQRREIRQFLVVTSPPTSQPSKQ